MNLHLSSPRKQGPSFRTRPRTSLKKLDSRVRGNERVGRAAVFSFATSVALLALPAAAAEEGRVAYGDSAGFTAALGALGLACKASAAEDTSCTAMGKDGGIMAVTMNSAGMLSVVFAGRGVDSPSVAEAYRAVADRLPFGDGSLHDRFADPPAIVAFCKDAGYVGVGDDANWCDATVVFSSAGDTVVQNLTQDALQALGSAKGIDRATVNAAVDRAPLSEGVFVAVQDSAAAPRMSAIAWLPTERFASNAE